jgi:hypothetical protein
MDKKEFLKEIRKDILEEEMGEEEDLMGSIWLPVFTEEEKV